MNFCDQFARELRAHGIDTIFGVLGDGNLFLMDSFEREHGGRYVAMAHESGGVLAASGYAQVTGRVGVATVTYGPGLTNTVTALVDGARSNTPLLLIAGDTASGDRDNLQNIDHREIARSTGAGFEQVRSPRSGGIDLARALRRAKVEHRPIVLNVPIDFQSQLEPFDTAPESTDGLYAPAPDEHSLDVAVGVIASSRRPIVLAGRGAISDEARVAMVRLAHQLGAPLATTLQAKDLFRGEAHNLGIVGGLAHETALDTVAQSDCVIAFGASLNALTTAEGSLTAAKQLVHVDIDPQSIGRFTKANCPVVADAAAAATAMSDWLEKIEFTPTGFASAALASRLSSAGPTSTAESTAPGTVPIAAALDLVDAVAPSDRTLVMDGGRFFIQSLVSLHVTHPRSFVHTGRFGSIGLGMAHAIGAAFGAPTRPVLLACGDGGFTLGGLAEFNSAVRHGLDITVLVLNDGAYGAEHVRLRSKGMDPSIATFDWPDFGSVATALGGQGFSVRDLEGLKVAMSEIKHGNGPALVDVHIDPEKVPWPYH